MREEMFTDEELEAAKATAETPGAEAPTGDGGQPEGGEPAAVADAPAGGEGAPAVDEAAKTAEEAKARTVPHEALHAERLRARQLAQELQAERDARERERARLDKIEAMLRGDKPQEPAEQDPIAVLSSVQQQTAQLLEVQQRQQQAAAAQQEEAFVLNTLVQSEATFKAVKPDYDAAAEFLWNSRVAEAKLWGLGQDEAEEAVRAEIGQWSRQALAVGRSPAELFYGLAESRGYRTAAPAANPAAVPQPSGVEKVAAIKQAQQQSRSLSSAAGAAPAGDVNIRALLEMDDDEFAASISKVQFRKVAGG